MYDIVSLYLKDDTIKCMSVWTLSISALIIFAIAFAVTNGAGFGSPMALLRWFQRFCLCGLSVAAAYAAAFIAYTGWTPPGPILILFVAFMVVVVISAARHVLLAPTIGFDDSWHGAWRSTKRSLRRLMLDHDVPHGMWTAR